MSNKELFGKVAIVTGAGRNIGRAIAKMPKQGSKRPWRLYQNYVLDIVTLRFGKVDDGVMKYS